MLVGRCTNSWKNKVEGGSPLQVSLRILPNPYKMLGLEPTVFILLWEDLSIISSFFLIALVEAILFSRIYCGYNWKSIVDIIRNKYAETYLRKIQGFENSNFKLQKCHLDLMFLLDCKKTVLFQSFCILS